MDLVMVNNIVKARVIFAMVTILTVIAVCNGTMYKVGDSSGWTSSTMDKVDYKLWSAIKTFQVGDVIQFEYNPLFHNVMRVTHEMYKSCNASLPIASYTSGKDSIKLTTHGHHFFICGVPGHCQSGQKIDINVPRVHNSVTASAPSPSIFVSPSVPIATKSPSPSPNKAISPIRSNALVLISLVSMIFGSFYLV